MMSFWRTGEKPEKAEIEGPGFEHIAFFASLQRIFKKDHGFGYRYFPWKSDTLKNVVIFSIHAIFATNTQVAMLAQSILNVPRFLPL